MKRSLSAYSHIIFYYNSRIHSKLKVFLTKVSEKFLMTSSSDHLSDATPVLFLHRIAESVSPPNLTHLVYGNRLLCYGLVLHSNPYFRPVFHIIMNTNISRVSIGPALETRQSPTIEYGVSIIFPEGH